MKVALLFVAAAVVVGFLMARSRVPVVVSGAPGAPAVTAAPAMAAPASEMPSAPAVPASSMATPILKTPVTVTPVGIRKPGAKAEPLASSKN